MTQKWYILIGDARIEGCREVVTTVTKTASPDAPGVLAEAFAAAVLRAGASVMDADPFLSAIYGPFEAEPGQFYSNPIAL